MINRDTFEFGLATFISATEDGALETRGKGQQAIGSRKATAKVEGTPRPFDRPFGHEFPSGLSLRVEDKAEWLTAGREA